VRSVASESNRHNQQIISTETKRSSGSHRRKPKKPAKPKRFPLTANGNGKWSKRINGKVYYFGTWDAPMGTENAISTWQYFWRRVVQIEVIGRVG